MNIKYQEESPKIFATIRQFTMCIHKKQFSNYEKTSTKKILTRGKREIRMAMEKFLSDASRLLLLSFYMLGRNFSIFIGLSLQKFSSVLLCLEISSNLKCLCRIFALNFQFKCKRRKEKK